MCIRDRKDISNLTLELSFQKASRIALNIQEIDLPEEFNSSSVEILGCDSIFEFNGRAFGKPSGKEEAYRRWSIMSGEFGFLHTGHTLLISTFDSSSKVLKVIKEIKETVITKVYFSRLEDEEIKSYVNSLEPLYCAGGFALEGIGGQYIDKICLLYTSPSPRDSV